MEIIRGTTPTIVIELEDDVNFSELGRCVLRIKQGELFIDKEPYETSLNEGKFKYTEEETLKLIEGKAWIQLVGKDENVEKTDVYEINILKSLWNEVV